MREPKKTAARSSHVGCQSCPHEEATSAKARRSWARAGTGVSDRGHGGREVRRRERQQRHRGRSVPSGQRQLEVRRATTERRQPAPRSLRLGVEAASGGRMMPARRKPTARSTRPGGGSQCWGAHGWEGGRRRRKGEACTKEARSAKVQTSKSGRMRESDAGAAGGRA